MDGYGYTNIQRLKGVLPCLSHKPPSPGECGTQGKEAQQGCPQSSELALGVGPEGRAVVGRG